MRILFLHGWQSIPGGVKPTFLKEHGHDVINPALQRMLAACEVVPAMKPGQQA